MGPGMTSIEGAGNAVGERNQPNDEARKIVEDDRLICEQNGMESDLFVAADVGVNHYRIVGELIKDYRKSKRVVEDPMVVMFEQTKEYQIRAKKDLTPGLWVEKAICDLWRTGNGRENDADKSKKANAGQSHRILIVRFYDP
jgi:hypothetical protein